MVDVANMRPYGRLIPYALAEWPAMALILVLSAAASALAALQPWPVKLLVDHALRAEPLPAPLRSILEPLGGVIAGPTGLVFAAAAATVLLFALDSAVECGLVLAWAAAGQRMVYRLAGDLFNRLQYRSLPLRHGSPLGDSRSLLTVDSRCVYTVVESFLTSPALHILTLVIVGAAAWKLDPGLAALSLVVAPVLAGSALLCDPGRRSRLSRGAEARLLTLVQRTFGSIPAVQAFGTEERSRAGFRINSLAVTVGTGIVLYAGGTRVLSGALSPGTLLVFLVYLRSLQSAVHGLLGIYGGLRSVSASIDRVREVLGTGEGVREAPRVPAVAVQATGR